jgi:hypothetical protein
MDQVRLASRDLYKRFLVLMKVRWLNFLYASISMIRFTHLYSTIASIIRTTLQENKKVDKIFGRVCFDSRTEDRDVFHVFEMIIFVSSILSECQFYLDCRC